MGYFYSLSFLISVLLCPYIISNFFCLCLFQAVLKRNLEAVRFLVHDACVNINKKDIFGNSPLDSAFKLQYNEIIEILTSVASSNNQNGGGSNNKYYKMVAGSDILMNGLNQNNFINCKMNGDPAIDDLC